MSLINKRNSSNIAKKNPCLVIQLAKQLTPILNEVHATDFSENYWLRLLYGHLKNSIRQKEYLENKEVEYRPLLFSIDSFRPLSSKEILKNYGEFFLRSFYHSTNLRQELEKIYKQKDICLGQRANIISKYNNGEEIKRLFVYSILFRIGEKPKRSKIKKIAKEQNSIFFKNVLNTIPQILVEYYSFINGLFDVVNPVDKRFHVEHKGSFIYDFILAKYREFGSRIIGYQGGGFVGEVSYIPDLISYQFVDEYRTYGWKSNEKDVPDKPYRLIEYKRDWENAKDRGIDFKGRVLLIFSSIDEYTLPFYHQFVENFFAKVPENFRSNIIARPRPRSRKIDNSTEAKRLHIPQDIQIDNGKQKLAETAANVELVVQTTLPATNFLECIYVGQPVMAINTNDEPSELWQSFVPVLERLGIIYNRMEELIDAVINTKDYTEWWKNVEADKHFQEFAATFAGKY